jgi:hypothetical protein
MSSNLLPAEFGDLACYASEWSLLSEQARHRKRNATDLNVVTSFYRTVIPRMDAIIEFLDRFPPGDLDSLPTEVRNLYALALAVMEVSHPVDMGWRSSDIEDSFPAYRFQFLEPSDRR